MLRQILVNPLLMSTQFQVHLSQQAVTRQSTGNTSDSRMVWWLEFLPDIFTSRHVLSPALYIALPLCADLVMEYPCKGTYLLNFSFTAMDGIDNTGAEIIIRTGVDNSAVL